MKSFDCVPQFAKMLHNLDHWLEKASRARQGEEVRASTCWSQARLAPDQYPLGPPGPVGVRLGQVLGRVSLGQKAPAHPDTEKTIAELRAAHPDLHLAYLETVKEADFAGAEERKVSPTWLGGKWIRGDQYLMQMALPNFYFHVTTAYAILRHNGVDLGKMDFIGQLPVKD